MGKAGDRPYGRSVPRLLPRILPALLAVPLLTLLPVSPAEAATRVDRQRVAFDVVNTPGVLGEPSLDPLCTADREEHVLRGTLVGPRRALSGLDPVVRVNVLLHDAGTGGWFWNLRERPRYDYATRLAAAGETTLVLDRLGYGRSPLADGNDTCLAAQAEMVHQVVQHLYSGSYRSPAGEVIGAEHVVLHGHGTGATVAQLESAEHRDVQGVVLLSPVTTSPSTLAVETLSQQSGVCLEGATYAAFGETARDYRRLLFASAPASVRREAVQRRSPTPCGDVATVVPAVTEATTAELEGPVLRVVGDRDRRRSGGEQPGREGNVTTRVVEGAGSALPLERQAPAVRRMVLRWLGNLTGF